MIEFFIDYVNQYYLEILHFDMTFNFSNNNSHVCVLRFKYYFIVCCLHNALNNFNNNKTIRVDGPNVSADASSFIKSLPSLSFNPFAQDGATVKHFSKSPFEMSKFNVSASANRFMMIFHGLVQEAMRGLRYDLPVSDVLISLLPFISNKINVNIFRIQLI